MDFFINKNKNLSLAMDLVRFTRSKDKLRLFYIRFLLISYY